MIWIISSDYPRGLFGVSKGDSLEYCWSRLTPKKFWVKAWVVGLVSFLISFFLSSVFFSSLKSIFPPFTLSNTFSISLCFLTSCSRCEFSFNFSSSLSFSSSASYCCFNSSSSFSLSSLIFSRFSLLSFNLSSNPSFCLFCSSSTIFFISSSCSLY